MKVYEKCCHCLGTRSRIMWCWPLCPGCVAGRRSWSGQPVNSSFKNVISFLYKLKSSITHTWTCIHYPTWRLVLWDKKNTVMISNSFLVLSLFGLCQDQQIWSNLYFWRIKKPLLDSFALGLPSIQINLNVTQLQCLTMILVFWKIRGIYKNKNCRVTTIFFLQIFLFLNIWTVLPLR